jgi:O-antigen ligase
MKAYRISFSKKTILRFLVVLVVVSIVVFFSLPTSFKEGLGNIILSILNLEGSTSAYVESNQVRFFTYRLGGEIFERNLWVGVGPGNWTQAANEIQSIVVEGIAATSRRVTPHNIYLEVGGELGLIGLVAYLLVGLSVFRNFSLTARRSFRLVVRLASVGWCASLISLSIYNLFVAYPYVPELNGLLWVIVGISTVVRASVTKQSGVSNLEEVG